jgi:hypothetical protein
MVNKILPLLEFATTAAGNLHPDISNARAKYSAIWTD